MSKTVTRYCEVCDKHETYESDDAMNHTVCKFCEGMFCLIHDALHGCNGHEPMSADEFKNTFDQSEHWRVDEEA